MADTDDTIEPGSPCEAGGEHRIKFNSGNPVCLKCEKFVAGEPRVVLPATANDDGTFTIHDPLRPDQPPDA